MSGLVFGITGAKARQNAASPTIEFGLHVGSSTPIEALVLRAQLRIEPQWRAYRPQEQTLLGDLFDRPDRWHQTLRAFSWADVSLTVTAFEESTDTQICIPCTYDFDQAATRYFEGLTGGEVPVRFLFSGAIFSRAGEGFSTERVPWSSECAYRMPVEVWRQAMRACYGDDALIRVSRDVLEMLNLYRARSGATSWNQILERLMGAPT